MIGLVIKCKMITQHTIYKLNYESIKYQPSSRCDQQYNENITHHLQIKL